MAKIELIQGNITETKADALVNASNTSLLSGSDMGVNGAIHRVGGPEIAEACKQLRIKMGALKPGDAVLTTAGALPARYVVHAVGPVWQGGKQGEEEMLREAYLNALKIAAEHDVKVIAFPCISTGAYQFPKEKAAAIALKAVQEHSVQTALPEIVVFVMHNDENFQIYNRLMQPA